MTIRLGARWRAGEADLDPRIIPLLRAVAKEGSLNRAVSSLRLSYRHAWGLLGKFERALGNRLVLMERGRGARLTPFAERLLEVDDAAMAILERGLAEKLEALNRPTLAAHRLEQARPLVMHASHDLALAELRELLNHGADGPVLDLQFRGSLDSLADLARGRCDAAGFHMPAAPGDSHAHDPYRPLLRARSLRLAHFVTRRQGLMVARGNPMGIRELADLADGRTRFINRQPGSGTRLCLEQMLTAQHLRPAQIAGYQNEEFTHAAVAATVASGMADAGFGIEAAARQQGLDFIPLATERYFLAARAGTVAGGAFALLLEALKSAAFRKCLEALPGYEMPHIGKIVLPREVLAAA